MTDNNKTFGGAFMAPDTVRERIGLSDRPLKNYEARGKLLNAVPNAGSDPHQGAKFAQSYALDSSRYENVKLLP